MTNTNDPDEQTIRKEIIRRIFEQEKRQKDRRTQLAYDEATAAIAEQFSDLPPEANSSRTQLKGQVAIDGRRYTAYIADSGVNDADFTNDGIQIDLDGDGEIDRKSERFPPGRPAVVNGTAYRFHIDL